MYSHRKRKSSLSFSRFVSVVLPFASDGSCFVEVTPQRRDMLYSHQIVLKHPEALDENSFYIVGVCDRERQSERILDALLKNGVIDEETGAIHTNRIGPKFIHQLSFLGQYSQKNLINVLFFWEEEVQRLKKLAAEDEELGTLIAEGERIKPEMENLDRLKFARERVRMKKRQRPSQRHPDIEADTDATVAEAFLAPRGMIATPTGMPPSYLGHKPAPPRDQSVA